MGIRRKIASWLIGGLEKKEKDYTTMMMNNLSEEPSWNDWSTRHAVKEGMKSSTYVYACIDRLMSSAASVPWNAYTRNSKGDWEEAHNHPLEQLIQQPNPFMDRKQLIELITAHLYLGGNSLLQKIKVRGTTVELWAMQPDCIRPVPSKHNFIKEYKFKSGTDEKTFEADEIIHFMFTNPADLYWGLSPLQAGARTVDTDVEAVKWNKVAMENRAITDGVFTFENALSTDQWEEARRQVREQHQGSDNARNPWVLGAGATWHQMSLSPAEMDFIESRKMTREEICSIFQVPPPMVGIYDNATLSNMETARRIFWLDTIIPFLDTIQGVFNRTLAPEFGDNVWIGYDTSNVQALQENLGDKIDNAKQLQSMGYPVNDINKRLELGFDDIEGGDVGHLPMNLMPISFKPADRPNIEEEGKSVETKFFNLETDEQKELHWKAVDGRRKKWESKVADIVDQDFQKEAEKVIEAFKNGSESAAIREIRDNESSWEETFTAFYSSVMKDFGEEAQNSIRKSDNLPKETKFEFDLFDVGVQNWIRHMVGKNIKDISKTTQDRIKREISLGIEAGESSGEIARRIKGLYLYMGDVRSHVIARTEVGSAMNSGSHYAVKQTGLKYKRAWLSSMDDRTRESHEYMNGVTVEEDEPFNVNGNEMMFPGDSSLGADGKELIGCRCVETYEVGR